jgi:hypothetical protein
MYCSEFEICQGSAKSSRSCRESKIDYEVTSILFDTAAGSELPLSCSGLSS